MKTAMPSSVSDQVTGVRVELAGVSKRFGKQAVFSDLNLQVEPGEFMVILGESGCGKSTLLKLVAGLESLDSGKVLLNGINQSQRLPHQRDIAMIFQQGNGYNHLTVRENLCYARSPQPATNAVSDWVQALGLQSILDQKLAQLSGGQSQRVAIARAMLSNKPIVLLDEPFAHLNSALREEARQLVQATHAASQRTFLYVTHDSDEAMMLATRIATLVDGRIVQVDSPSQAYLRPASFSVAQLLGRPAANAMELPSSWMSLGSASADSKLRCAVRATDWQLMELRERSEQNSIGYQRTDRGLEIHAQVHAVHWLGSRWMLEADAANNDEQTVAIPLTIVCPAPAEPAMENLLQHMHSTKAGGWMRAVVAWDRILIF